MVDFYRVYNRLARAWYEQEHGVKAADWYLPAVLFMERLADQLRGQQ